MARGLPGTARWTTSREAAQASPIDRRCGCRRARRGSCRRTGAITPTITEFAAGLTAGGEPGSIAAGQEGNLWFLEYANTAHIGKITTAGAITEVATSGTPGWPSINPQPGGIVAGPDGNLWFTEGHNPGRIGKVDPATCAVTEVATGG